MASVVRVGTPTSEAARSLYPPSWVDRLESWIERLPGPVWLFYGALTLVLLAAEFISKWADGTYPAGFRLWHLVLAGTGVYLLGLVHGLDRAVARSLIAFRPVMIADEPTHDALHYSLTTLPARQTLLASLALGLFGLGVLVLTPASRVRMLVVFTSPTATVVDTALWLLSWWVGGAVVYHTIHQLRLISHILTRHTRINLFVLQPLYAFAWLTSVTAAGLVVVVYGWAATVPDAFTQADAPLFGAIALIILALAVSTFIWPLWGVHRLLLAEKQRWQADLAQRIQAAILELQRHTDTAETTNSIQWKNLLDGLLAGQGALDRVPTWPWPPGTGRSIATAVVLPILLWFVFHLLERLLPF